MAGFSDDHGRAPTYEVAERDIVAIEHPGVLLNLQKSLDSFGPRPHFEKLLEESADPKSVPLWFRIDDPTSKPLNSHHVTTNNVLLKITVPKRTGRKRKRGSDEPFSGDASHQPAPAIARAPKFSRVSSLGRQDRPASILRKVQDNEDRYRVEAVGMIRNSHRYRALADFQFANVHNPFLRNAAEHLLPLNLKKLRELKFEPGVAVGPGLEIIPPPHFTDKIIGYNYNYDQNPFVKDDGVDELGEPRLVNKQGRYQTSYGHFISHDHYPVPNKPNRALRGTLDVPDQLLEQLRDAMEQRPIWTRRALLNQCRGQYSETVLKVAVQLVGYQFKGGPFREAFIKYGLDPRSDPKYRVYQTLAFKLGHNVAGKARTPWHTIRRGQVQKHSRNRDHDSHLWDGESYSTDGKFWQVCDITDPLLVKMIRAATVRSECDINDSGWYQNGFWSKVKAFMRVKMIAIAKGRLGSEDDEPPKEGYIYNSLIMSKLEQYPDSSEKPVSIWLDILLGSVLNTGAAKARRKRRAYTINKMFPGKNSRRPKTGGDALPAVADEDESEDVDFDADAFSPDTAWAHILDSDLDDPDVGEEEHDDDDDDDDDNDGLSRDYQDQGFDDDSDEVGDNQGRAVDGVDAGDDEDAGDDADADAGDDAEVAEGLGVGDGAETGERVDM